MGFTSRYFKNRNLTYSQHLIESIVTILTTPKGTRYFNRNFGSDLYKYVDTYIDNRTKLEIYSEVIDSLEDQEERFRLYNVEVSTKDGDKGKLRISIIGLDIINNQLIRLNNIRIS